MMRQGSGYIPASQYVLVHSVQGVPWWGGWNRDGVQAGGLVLYHRRVPWWKGFWGLPHRRHFDRVAGSKVGMRQEVLEDSVLRLY